MQIISVKLTDIKPYAKNPRNNAAAVDLVAASIREFGFKVPIILDKKNVIVAGHTRLLAAKKLGMSEVPCVMADDLTDEQIKAFRLADNKTAEASEWDMALLSSELDSIFDLDMTQFGFLTDPEPEDVELERVELQPYTKVHYLISLDLNLNDQVIELIDQLRKIGGVEVVGTHNNDR